MRRSLGIAGMAGLVMALGAVFAVRAGLDRPVLAAVRAIDPRVAASVVIAAVLVQVALFLKVREEEELPAASRAPRGKVGRLQGLSGANVPTIARRTGLPQDVVTTALRQGRLATAGAAAAVSVASATPSAQPATRQKSPSTATIAPTSTSLNALIRRLTRS